MTMPIITASVVNPFSGVFGNGQMQIIPVSGTFVVPVGVANVRVRLWGAGGSGGNNVGGGGGFAMKVINVSGVSSVAVTVGAAVQNTTGGTSSFGSFVSATGGVGAGTGAGGTGVGGDVNYVGGTSSVGGGGAANLFGNGGFGGGSAGGNGASGGGANSTNTVGGNGIFSTGGGNYVTNGAPIAPTSGMISPSIDLIGTGGGGSGLFPNGVNGGGGAVGGYGGFPGGGTPSISGVGGRGLVIVEY